MINWLRLLGDALIAAIEGHTRALDARVAQQRAEEYRRGLADGYANGRAEAMRQAGFSRDLGRGRR